MIEECYLEQTATLAVRSQSIVLRIAVIRRALAYHTS